MCYAESAQSLWILPITIATPSFSPCRPRPAAPKKHPAGQFHQILIDEFMLLVDVGSFGFRLLRIGKAAIVSGCQRRFA
jgi:hypothetical protein